MSRLQKLVSALFRKTQELFAAKRPVYIFHHIPKSGGTSIVSVIDNWFTVVRDYRPSIELTDETIRYLEKKIDLGKLNSTHCLSGHFEKEGNYLYERYPQVLENPEEYKVFTFLREPMDLAISLYYYQIKTNIRKKEDQPLEDFLLSISNYTANRLPCTKENYRNILDKYFFIGINESMQDSLDRLAEILHKPKIIIPVLNQSSRDTQALNLSNTLISAFKHHNELDYLIYNYALNKFKEF